MSQFFAALIDLPKPIPIILTLAGIIFLFVAIMPVKEYILRPTINQRKLSGAVGGILIVVGILLSLGASQPQTPVATETPESTQPPSIALAIQSPTTFVPVTVSPSTLALDQIAITEVMASPCGGTYGPSPNEYIELYNYGKSSTDVGGWWFVTNNTGEFAHPNKIVSWDSRNPGIPLSDSAFSNSTIIPPSGFAIILTPTYYQGSGLYHMPYKFPKGVLLLTIETGQLLGNDKTGLLGNSDPLTVIVLYKGTNNIMINPISSYGSPVYGSAVDSVRNNDDGFPYPLYECNSMQRIIASGPDQPTNWQMVKNGNPSLGPYSP